MLTLSTRSQTMFFMVWSILWRLSGIAFALYAAYRIRFIVVIVLLAAILTFAVNPLVNRACRLRPRWAPRHTWRFLTTFTIFVGLIILCVGVSLWLWAPFQAQLIDLQSRIGDYQATIQLRLGVVKAWYDRLPVAMKDALAGEPVAGLINDVLGVVRDIIESTVSWVQHVWELILIPVLAFYFCLDSRSLKRELMILVPYRRVRETLFILTHAGRIMQNYVIAQFILCAVAGVTVGVGLWLMDVPYPLVLGVLAGITRAVPIVGPILGAIPITLLALTVSVNTGVSVLIFFSVLHLVESKVLLPELIGHSIKLHPAIILIVLLIGAEFFGILGMFLAAPVAAILRMLLSLYVIEPEMARRKAALAVPNGQAEELDAEKIEDAFRKVS